MEEYDDDEDNFGGAYEDGHWEWDDNANELVFISDLVIDEQEEATSVAINFGTITFKDDVDLIEQQKFRKRCQRKATVEDVITLQDVKDIVLFTAPQVILQPAVIKMLHLRAMDRFLRALIMYCQYFLQITFEMDSRKTSELTKLRTSNSKIIEATYQENLEDLRLIVAKEYSIVIMGDGDFAKYHHMGPSKKSHSLSKVDALFFESILRISIQIVWIALGRKSFNQIELEVHRIFKSHTFNIAEHRLVLKNKMSDTDRSVLLGACLKLDKKLNTRSPLMNEVTCERDIDYRIYGLGIVKYPRLNSRLRYMECALVDPEKSFIDKDISLGILGHPRVDYDIMLKKILKGSGTNTSISSVSVGKSSSRRLPSRSKSGQSSTRKSLNIAPLYRPIYLPEKTSQIEMPLSEFSAKCKPMKSNDQTQRRMWLQRISHKNKSKG